MCECIVFPAVVLAVVGVAVEEEEKSSVVTALNT